MESCGYVIVFAWPHAHASSWAQTVAEFFSNSVIDVEKHCFYMMSYRSLKNVIKIPHKSQSWTQTYQESKQMKMLNCIHPPQTGRKLWCTTAFEISHQNLLLNPTTHTIEEGIIMLLLVLGWHDTSFSVGNWWVLHRDWHSTKHHSNWWLCIISQVCRY